VVGKLSGLEQHFAAPAPEHEMGLMTAAPQIEGVAQSRRAIDIEMVVDAHARPPQH